MHVTPAKNCILEQNNNKQIEVLSIHLCEDGLIKTVIIISLGGPALIEKWM